eukprot:CAMPEP_0196803378 /NCGR_PEP_ID=MMETSP1362-20130617/2759_1 /TAXON_ID=163516 /ORGANISM="Leptocylindrus danicus, Strain CCMP1856" /LENGTH=187 /DNA_ID=CAMNT_0042174913 /DNA_START=80 /DNA_END=643 /DNA_ORIENTATION=+
MADSNNNASSAQSTAANENTTRNARSARNNNNNRNQYSRYVRQFNNKFHKLSFNSQSLKLTHFQKFKTKTLGVILVNTEVGKPLHDDVKNGKDTWTNRKEPAQDPNDDRNKYDRKEHRETKKKYLNDSLKIATMVMAQCDDFVRAKITFSCNLPQQPQREADCIICQAQGRFFAVGGFVPSKFPGST